MKEVLDIIDGAIIMEFNTSVLVMEIYMELEIMIWIFVVCGDYGDNGDYYEDLNMRISRNICLGNDRRFYLIDEWEDNENID